MVRSVTGGSTDRFGELEPDPWRRPRCGRRRRGLAAGCEAFAVNAARWAQARVRLALWPAAQVVQLGSIGTQQAWRQAPRSVCLRMEEKPSLVVAGQNVVVATLYSTCRTALPALMNGVSVEHSW